MCRGTEVSLTRSSSETNGCVWVPVPRLMELPLLQQPAVRAQIQRDLWCTMISAQVKDRKEQGSSPGKDGRRWRTRSDDGKCAPSRDSQALPHGQQRAVHSSVLSWSNFHSSAESQREHTWGVTPQRLTLSVLYWGLFFLDCGVCDSGKGSCCWTVPMMNQIWRNHAKKKTIQRDYEVPVKQSHHTGAKRNQYNRSCNLTEKLSLLRT